jgi:transposase
MKAYSIDLRERVVQAYEEGKGSIEQIASMFNVGETFVKKMLRQKRETGSVNPLPHGGGNKPKLSKKEDRLLEKEIKSQSDVSLSELQEYLLKKSNLNVSLTTIHRALERLGLPRKKKSDSIRT